MEGWMGWMDGMDGRVDGRVGWDGVGGGRRRPGMHGWRQPKGTARHGRQSVGAGRRPLGKAGPRTRFDFLSRWGAPACHWPPLGVPGSRRRKGQSASPEGWRAAAVGKAWAAVTAPRLQRLTARHSKSRALPSPLRPRHSPDRVPLGRPRSSAAEHSRGHGCRNQSALAADFAVQPPDDAPEATAANPGQSSPQTDSTTRAPPPANCRCQRAAFKNSSQLCGPWPPASQAGPAWRCRPSVSVDLLGPSVRGPADLLHLANPALWAWHSSILAHLFFFIVLISAISAACPLGK